MTDFILTYVRLFVRLYSFSCSERTTAGKKVIYILGNSLPPKFRIDGRKDQSRVYGRVLHRAEVLMFLLCLILNQKTVQCKKAENGQKFFRCFNTG